MLDRVEVIRVPGYTREEKVSIAQRYLLPTSLRNHGLLAHEVALNRSLVNHIVAGYTYEAGVRQLKRLMDGVCRAVAVDLVQTRTPPAAPDQRTLWQEWRENRPPIAMTRAWLEKVLGVRL